jgi:hypothetical protein
MHILQTEDDERRARIDVRVLAERRPTELLRVGASSDQGWDDQGLAAAEATGIQPS